MELRSLLAVFLLLDALVVFTIGLSTMHHGEHSWDFFLVNGLRLGATACILALARLGNDRRVQNLLFRRRRPE